ncbi:MAG: hypothetical protein K0S47_3512 [Herbinix sp.]|jgi:uncharacterized protein YdhG (YjbR/CyaY superfamily)|nr:hypothetical protein [Herbinix sp.]
MTYEANNPEEYIEQLPIDRKEPFRRLRNLIKENLPLGFEETMSYGMVSFVVPHSIYAPGYHVNPKEPIPFISIASQKNFIAFYHMGIYSMPDLLSWFQDEYPKYSSGKLDMGKSCIRFKNMEKIPYELLARLCSKITLEEYLQKYLLELKK